MGTFTNWLIGHKELKQIYLQDEPAVNVALERKMTKMKSSGGEYSLLGQISNLVGFTNFDDSGKINNFIERITNVLEQLLILLFVVGLIFLMIYLIFS